MADLLILLWGNREGIPDKFSVLPAVDDDRDHPGRVPTVHSVRNGCPYRV